MFILEMTLILNLLLVMLEPRFIDRRTSNSAAKVASLIAQGYIVGRFRKNGIRSKSLRK